MIVMRGFVAQTSINVVAEEYERGQCIVSDQHSDLTAAKKAVLPSVPWQRCQFHLMQNAMHYIPKLSMRKEAEEDLRAAYGHPTILDASGTVLQTSTPHFAIHLRVVNGTRRWDCITSGQGG
jgi:transposase-like protein